MTRFAPANDAGDKPYVVEGWVMGRVEERVVYAPDQSTAKHRSGFSGTGRYVRKVRRAQPADIDA